MSNQLIKAEDLSLVSQSALNEKQLQQLLKKTPEKYLKKRPAKGGGTWDYVSGGYVKKVLNLMFGFDWDFEILEQLIMHGEAIVKGRLTCRTNGKTIIKTQFGNKDIMFKKQTDQERIQNAERIPLSIGNDLKSAATDCLKKCAAEIGIAADVYNKEEFREIILESAKDNDLLELFELKRDSLTTEEIYYIEDSLNYNRKENYTKIKKLLESK
jgi:recombination DNA repair RAD52 pathway protein